MARAVSGGSRADTVLLSLCVGASILLILLPSAVRGSVAAGFRRTAVSPLAALQQRAELSRTAYLSYSARTRDRDSLVMRAVESGRVAAENVRLRKLLGLGRQLEWGFVPAEALHGRSLGDQHTIALTAGARAGIRPYSPVIAPEGLVGMVQTVDPSLSLAILWTHPDFRVSAMAADESAVGIVQAHLGEGAERFLLELGGVPFRSALKPGTLIVSSGLGGTYPRGIPVGTVLGEIRTTEGWARRYLMRPAVLPPDVGSVMILQPQRATAGVQSVWSAVTSPDSAVRGVVAGGDSLARDMALAEAAARRAALGTAGVVDTMRRADSARATRARVPVAPVVRRAPRPVPPPDTARPDTSVRPSPP